MKEEEPLYGNVPIGDTFKYKGKIYEVVKQKSCRECDLVKECAETTNMIFACGSIYRDDCRACSFKLIKNG